MSTPLTDIDKLKSIAYTAITMKESVENLYRSFDDAKKIVDRWVNDFDVDIKDYFKKENYKLQDESTGRKLSTKAWEAFEYFNII